MFEIIIFFFSSRLPRSRWLFRLTFNVYAYFCKIRGRDLRFDAVRFENATWVQGSRIKYGSANKTIELVVVSTSKDFDILFHSVTFALKAISHYRSGGVRIIVPSRDVGECRLLFKNLSNLVTVVDESSLISRSQFSVLTDGFGPRNTWVLQQLLKVQAVMESKSDAVLILDSDTVLLRKRAWFDAVGRQILMPTSEFNPPYYEFLNKLGISLAIPKYSFISHHMIMQPDVLRGILENVGLADLDNLIEYCVENSDRSVQSPICIEYELYGQTIFNNNRDQFFIAPWSNATIPKKYSELILNSRVLKFILTRSFNSISFHSWS